MAKAAGREGAGLDKAGLKQMLRHALTEPVTMAFALGADGKALLQMHKRKPSRALEKDLKDGAPDSKNHRFGMAMVDPEDPKAVRFVVNKASGGMARKLVMALKGTGYSKVKIVLEDGTSVEVDEGEDDGTDPTRDDGLGGAHAGHDAQGGDQPHTSQVGSEGSEAAPPHQGGNGRPPPPGAQPHAGTAPPTGAQPSPATSDALPPETGPQPGKPGTASPGNGAAPSGQAGKPDAAALARDLTALIKRMLDAIRAHPEQKAALVELATDAQASLKRGDLDQAAAGIDVLRQAVSDAAGSGASSDDTSGSGAAKDGSPSGVAGDGGGAVGADPIGASPTDAGTGDAGTGDAGTNAAGGVPDGAGTGDDAPAKVDDKDLQVFAKSQRAWIATRAKVDSDIRKLHASILAANDGDFGDDLESSFLSAVEPVLATLDESLSDILSDASQASDPAQNELLRKQTRATLARYANYVQSEPIIRHLDDNPFVPMQIGKTLTATLTTLSGLMR